MLAKLGLEVPPAEGPLLNPNPNPNPSPNPNPNPHPNPNPDATRNPKQVPPAEGPRPYSENTTWGELGQSGWLG